MNSDSKQDFHVGDLVQFQAVPSAEPLLGVISRARDLKYRNDPTVLVRWQDGTQNNMSQSRISLLVKAQHSDE